MTLKIKLKVLAFHAAGLFLFCWFVFAEFSSVSAQVPVTPDRIAGDATATIEGFVIDMLGKPVENAAVSAYMNPAANEKPAFVSMNTGADGKYVLRVAQGTYYLKVSSNGQGGPPSPGQIVGFFGERTPPMIDIKERQAIKGVNFKVILFSERRGQFPGPGPAANPRPEPGPQR